MFKSSFKITGMDCPSEERMIRLKLENVEGIEEMTFDIPARKLEVFHSVDNAKLILEALHELKMGSSLENSEVSQSKPDNHSALSERKVLWWVLAINFTFFIVELSTGFISNSMGLVADSLDMLADSFVYGLSLMAVGRAIARKKQVARISGYFQITLALIGFAEVIRRFLGFESVPDYQLMIIVSIAALLGNAVCLWLLKGAKSKEVHMQASWIFTSNDVLVNLGVIAAAVLIIFTGSGLPDLIIGFLVFGLVLRGAIRILKLSN